MPVIPHIGRFRLLSTFPFQELDQVTVALASHRSRSAGVLRALSPIKARGSSGTSCARHRAAYTVWRARAVDGSYGGDVDASRGRTSPSPCTVSRVPCWSTGAAAEQGFSPCRLYGRDEDTPRQALRPTGRYSHRLHARRRSSARRAVAVIGSPRGGRHRFQAEQRFQVWAMGCCTV
jgi:hypothetical protein